MIPPINFMRWIEDNREKLIPPVCNQVVYRADNFIIMVVGGPNRRHDFHVNQTEEFFYQLEGNMLLKIVEDGEHKDIPIQQGEIFLLPAKIPHSPQRFENTVGLVIEQVRPEGMLDGFEFYCEQCQHEMHIETLHVHDIVKQLPPIFERFYKAHNICQQCHYEMVPYANH